MKYALPAAIVLAATLTACERPATTSSTTVVQPTKETVVQREVVVAPAAPSTPVDATKPETTTTERSTKTERVDTPMGTATRTETSKTTTK